MRSSARSAMFGAREQIGLSSAWAWSPFGRVIRSRIARRRTARASIMGLPPSEALLTRLPCDQATGVSQMQRRTLDILELRNKSTMRSGVRAKGPSDNPARGLGPPARLSRTGRSVRRATWFQDTFSWADSSMRDANDR